MYVPPGGVFSVFDMLPAEMVAEVDAIAFEISDRCANVHHMDPSIQLMAAVVWCAREVNKLRPENERLRAELRRRRGR